MRQKFFCSEKTADSSFLVLGEKEERCKANQLCIKSNFSTTQYCLSKLMYSLPVEALNLTVVSKSLPVKVNNAADDLTVSLICPLR